MVVLVARRPSPLYVDGQFHGNWLLVASLAIGLVGFYCMHTDARARSRATRRFRPYGEMLATDGVVRLVGALVLLALGVDNAGAYGMCMALVAVRRRRASRCASGTSCSSPGPPAPYSELSNALGWLLAGSVLMQLLGYSSLLGVNMLKGPGDTAAVAAFTSAFFVARIPPLLFQAVQGTLLPEAGEPRRRGPPRRLPDRAQAAARASWSASPCSARSPRSRSACRVGKILFPPFNDRQPRPRAARRRQRHVHHRPDRRPGPARAEGPHGRPRSPGCSASSASSA